MRPLIAACGLESGIIYLWSVATPQKWSALAPDFAEVEESVEYLEREDEFEIHKRRLDLEDEDIDALTTEATKATSITNFGMPVLLDINTNNSDDDIVAMGPGTRRRRSLAEGRDGRQGPANAKGLTYGSDKSSKMANREHDMHHSRARRR
jgi:COMPASS component SWD1